MVETHSVFAIPYRVLYLGVAAVIGLEGEMISLPVGDEAMVGVIKERFVLRPRGGPDPSYDQAQRLAALEGRIGYLGHVGAAIEPVRYRTSPPPLALRSAAAGRSAGGQ